MMRSLRAQIALVLVVVVLALSLVGHFAFKATPPILGTTAIIVMLGILIVSSKFDRVLVTAQRQIQEYLSEVDPAPPDPPPPEEIQPFFDAVSEMQKTLQREKDRLSRETTERNRLDDAVQKAAQAVQSQPGLCGRFEAILPLVGAESGADAVGYFIWETAGLPPTLAAWRGPTPSMPERAVLVSSIENDLVQGKLAYVEALAADETPAGLRVYGQEREFTTALFAPAQRDKKTIGYLAMFFKTNLGHSPALDVYLERLKQPLAWAQDAASRYERALETERVGKTVNELLMAAGTSFGLDEAAERTLERLFELEPFSRGAVLLVENEEFLEVFAPTRPGETGYFLGSRLRKEGACVAPVMETRMLQLEGDLSANQTFNEDSLLVDEGYRSRLVFPLVAGGKAIGAVYLVNREINAFSKEKADLLRVPLEAVAVALETLRFNRKLGEKVSSLDVGMAEKGLFLTGLNHEIRSQLRTLMELAEPLLDRKTSGLKTKASESVQEILARSRQLLGMLDGVVDIERMDAGEKSLHIEEFFITEAIKDVLWDLQPVLKSRNLEIVWEVPQGLPAMIADADRFRSLLYQLLMRAAQTTPSGGQVTFRANLLPASWLKEKAKEYMPPEVAQAVGAGAGVDVMIFGIVDQGETVPAEIRKKIFVEGGTPGMDSETALKLYFVRRVVEMHRGQIWMEPVADGQGNRVGVVMPQYSLDRVGFVNYVGKRLKEARETLSCLSLISVGYKDRTGMREMLGEETFYRAMKELEGVVRQAIREPVDSVRRFQNGELIVIFAEADRTGAARMLERLLGKVTSFQTSVLTTTPEVVTSVATYPDDALRAEDIIRHLEVGVGVA
ncbi:MAG: GAF domain-containing sensor histidine kinase [Armatimonadetes bacterium]|nr:GAF domain-containing sensor histidine kinase [Armatimonadota bacterium]